MKKTAVVILAIILMFTAVGCRLIPGNSADKEISGIQDTLYQKYGCTFDTVRLVERIEGVRAVYEMTPSFDSAPTVKAELDLDTGRITDNLIDRLAGRSFSDEINAALAAQGVSIASWTTFVCAARDRAETDISITLDEYTERYYPEDAMVYFTIDQNCIVDDTAKKLTDTFAEMSRKYQMTVVLYGVIMDEDYVKCADQIMEQSDLTSSWLKSFESKDAFQYAVTDGVSNLSDNDLQAILNGTKNGG